MTLRPADIQDRLLFFRCRRDGRIALRFPSHSELSRKQEKEIDHLRPHSRWVLYKKIRYRRILPTCSNVVDVFLEMFHVVPYRFRFVATYFIILILLTGFFPAAPWSTQSLRVLDALQSLMQWSSQQDALRLGRTVPRFPCSHLHAMQPEFTCHAFDLFYLTFSLFKHVGSKSSRFDCVKGEQITSQWVKAHHLQYLILVQLHSRKGIIVFSPNSRNLLFFLIWSWPTLHLMAAWSHIGFLVCKLCSEL